MKNYLKSHDVWALNVKGKGYMTKSDLIKLLAENNNLKKERAEEIVDLVFNGFTNALKNKGRIEIRGFGSFSVRKYKAYKGRNPKTGKTVSVKPKRAVFFKVGKELKKKVDNNG
jgi:integration host factor subunit beta